MEVDGEGPGGEDVGGEGAGGEKEPSSCGICLLLASTAIRLLAQVTLLKFFARFRGGELGCSDWPSCGDGTS
jgi:hypothetical protein